MDKLNRDGLFYFMSKPKYKDPPQTFPEQINSLSKDGMVITPDAEKILSHTSYYRLSGFWRFYRSPEDHKFNEGLTFETIWEDYRNDRRLRLLIMDSVERIEVSFKTKLANILAIKSNSPFPHLNLSYLNKKFLVKKFLTKDGYKNAYEIFLDAAKSETTRSTEEFVKKFKDEYDEEYLPIWMLVEILSFGTVSKYYKLLIPKIKKEIAKEYNLEYFVFENWLQFLSIVRNVCCHHARFWRKTFTWKPRELNKNKYSDWNPNMNFNQVYGLLCILKYFMNIIRPQSRWHDDIINFLKLHKIEELGFPADWKNFVPWKEK